MSDQDGGGAWFRRRRFGYGYSVATWQGFVTTLAFVLALLATIFAADPNTAKPSSVPLFLKMKALFGLSGAHWPVQVMLPLLLGETGAFLFVVWWTSRSLRPLD